MEHDLGYWEVLLELIDSEPPYDGYRNEYGELAALGIAKGRPFDPDERMRDILVRAAQITNAHMRVQSFTDRRSDRAVWEGTHWEWAVLRPENGRFDAQSYVDLDAREKWFFQAQIESPAMFARSPGAGSLYWLCARDGGGAYLDGGHSYRLSVPLPVPDKLFWSVTVLGVASFHRTRWRQVRRYGNRRTSPDPGLRTARLTPLRRPQTSDRIARRPHDAVWAGPPPARTGTADALEGRASAQKLVGVVYRVS